MEKIVDIVAPRSVIDLILKVAILLLAYIAIDQTVGNAMQDLIRDHPLIDPLMTIVLGAPFVFFVMSTMGVQRKLKERLQYLAETDQLTGLANRQTFLERASKALAEHPHSTVLMIDVDHFKAVNDTYGHFAGDISLRTVSNHLSDNVRAEDIVGRLGGEEFAVLLRNADRKKAEAVSARICGPITIDTAGDLDEDPPSFDLTMSVGGIMALPGQSLTELIRHADEALYRAKSTGRARAVFYEREGIERRRAS
ncbi:GGDEF domain-containing protein [Loktanella sp. 5RATIMAR09]|jgi:diguanylate cyclase (GGDEF)-like protein|uniref:GGDEF domain-containing protein n=1 Tax=Loktanella sp. 5RATIMAR09 TaxID=1225655 RepID=UPI0006DCD809|nr:GGDEF domain-containing protein [Loktanella sp. 5RATIMAR09]